MNILKNNARICSSQRGFTLLEVLVVMSIMIALTSISISTYISMRDKQSVQKDADSIVSVLQKAQSMSSNRKNDSAYGVKFASSTVTVFSGSTYDTGNVISTYTLEKNVKINTIILSSNGTEVDFMKITGNPLANGTVTLGTGSFSKIVTIYGTGIIELK